jgi:ribulose-bisphosphate carboxylase large chain
MERIVATYQVETPLEIERAARVLAAEQSSGTFVAVPGETEDLRARHGARVERIVELESVEQASLPGSRPAPGSRGYRRAEIEVSWPMENVGTNLPALVTTLQGNLYELAEFSGLRLVDFELPEAFWSAFRGPRFGVEGTRALTGVHDRPLIGTIIKPSIGLSPEQTATLVAELCEAGIDFIKDDELMANPPHSPLRRRVAAVMRVINDHAARTGRKVMYAFNISDEIDAMLGHYETVRAAGGTAVMMSLNPVGLCAARKICDIGALAVHGHRNGFGMLNRHPWLGMDFRAYQALWRLAGIDQLHVNGLANKFWEDDDSVVRSIEACLRPAPAGARLMPVVSSGQWGGQAPQTFARTRTLDLLYLAGGGIMAHPQGPRGGVAAIRQSWEAAVAGVPLTQAAQHHQELRQQLAKFAGQPD